MRGQRLNPQLPVLQLLLQRRFDAAKRPGNQGASKQDASEPCRAAQEVQPRYEAASMLNLAVHPTLTKTERRSHRSFFWRCPPLA
jgi:hypothetical protein